MKLRKGFTLVELLIVIVIIGILAGAMLLASGAATASAEASNIVSNLRSLQSASLMFFADNMDAVVDPAAVAGDFVNGLDPLDAADGGEGVQSLTAYTANPEAPVWNNYRFVVEPSAHPIGEQAWWVGTDVVRADVGRRLAGRAGSVGLFSAPLPPASIAAPDFTDGDTEVYMLVRNPGN